MSQRHADNWSHPGHYLVDPYTWPWSPNGEDHIRPWKFKYQGHGRGQSSVDVFAFRFVAIGPFLAEIYPIRYLTLKIQGQGHDENRPKSNQLIYRSGPTIVPKIKEIQKVFQKLLREQESAAGGGVRTGTKT